MVHIRISIEEQEEAFQFLKELKLDMDSKFSHPTEYYQQRKQYLIEACKYTEQQRNGFHYEFFTYKDSRYVVRTDQLILTWDCFRENR